MTDRQYEYEAQIAGNGSCFVVRDGKMYAVTFEWGHSAAYWFDEETMNALIPGVAYALKEGRLCAFELTGERIDVQDGTFVPAISSDTRWQSPFWKEHLGNFNRTIQSHNFEEVEDGLLIKFSNAEWERISGICRLPPTIFTGGPIRYIEDAMVPSECWLLEDELRERFDPEALYVPTVPSPIDRSYGTFFEVKPTGTVVDVRKSEIFIRDTRVGFAPTTFGISAEDPFSDTTDSDTSESETS